MKEDLEEKIGDLYQEITKYKREEMKAARNCICDVPTKFANT